MSGQWIRQLNALRTYYGSGATKSYDFRKAQLKKLKTSLLRHEQQLHDAVYTDLKKSPEECWVTETGFLLSEINVCLKNLRQWMQPEKVPTNLVNFPSTSYVLQEPLGVVLIIGPWNYPLQLLFTPLAGAIAAGNCVVLKPSEFAPSTAEVMEKIIRETFAPEYILCVQGDGAEIVPAMMKDFRFDHVFYTGSTAVGKIVYKMAAEQLVPVTLELGGKSPAVVEKDANIRVAARRIAMTKFSNAGQMCVAPDYVLVHADAKEKLITAIQQTLQKFFTADPSSSYNYGKIINRKQFSRLVNYLQGVEILYGGKVDEKKLYIEPTLISLSGENKDASNPLLNEEIFGPILPILSFNTTEEAKAIISRNPDPLAFY